MSSRIKRKFQLSIVIPVCKISGRLHDLKETLLLVKEYRQIQVILVHDRQDANTGPELQELVDLIKNPNLTFIEEYFGNPGGARNAGLALATGDWVTFWDADDLGDPGTVLTDIETHGTDMLAIIGQFRKFDISRGEFVNVTVAESISDLAINPGLWRVSFRNCNLRSFPEISMGEDQVFLMENLPNVEKVYFSDKIYYIYKIGHISQLTKNRSKIKDLFLASEIIKSRKTKRGSKDNLLIMELLTRQYFTIIARSSLILRAKGLIKLFRILFAFGPIRTTKMVKKIVKSKVLHEDELAIAVSLTGGLGNQLFQIAAALSLSQGNPIRTIANLSAPRHNKCGLPDCFDFDLSNFSGDPETKRMSWWTQKVVGYTLRTGVSPRKFEKNALIRKIVRLTCSVIVSIGSRRMLSVIVGNGVGFFPIGKVRGSKLLIGYFQSYKWVEEKHVKSILSEMSIAHPSQSFLEYKDKVKEQKILSVHIRLGDYKSEENFGILSPLYYQKAIEIISQESSYTKIFAFSDEPSIARNLYLTDSALPIHWVNSSELSPSETLDIMRDCDGYVIANSTFSWWGAMLSRNLNAKVVAPSSWFKNLEEPLELIPKSWQRVTSDYIELNELSS